MSREVRRVPEGFDWPLNKVWEGFLTPEWLHEGPCPDCKNGYSAEADRFHDQWYGNASFDPASTRSARLTADTPAVRAYAQRNVEHSPDFYGTDPDAVQREGERLAKLWNAAWSHHLSQDDVDALVAGNRLWDFSHEFVRGEGWKPKDSPYHPTAAEVNAWSIGGLGHDSINAHIVIAARCEREGVPLECATCEGHGAAEKFKGQRRAAKKWKSIKPPRGDWWQLWETVSEGSPVTPAFSTAEELARHITGGEPEKYDGTLAWITGSGWAPSVVLSSAGLVTADEMVKGATL